MMYGVSNKSIFYYMLFFYEIRWIVKRGLWYYIRDETIRYELYRESCVFNASVVLVQPVVVVVVILFLQNTL
jgi:hypothetical protein